MSTSSILFFTFFDDFCNETIFSNILMCYDNDFLQISIKTIILVSMAESVRKMDCN